MDINKFYKIEGEKPLDFLTPDGGFCGIFRTIGIIGDSLASGELESYEEGISGYHDFYEYSWGQYIGRTIGSKVYNFSRGGMTAKEFYENFSRTCGVYEYDKLCQCYIIALGVNDLIEGMEIGDAKKAGEQYPCEGNQSIMAYYAGIIKKVKAKQPKAKIFLMTLPYSGTKPTHRLEMEERLCEEIRTLANLFKNTYVLDFRKYAPEYDEKFNSTFRLGHMTPCGYLLTAKMVMSYIDWIIRNNHEDFKRVGFIGTGYSFDE